MTGRAPTRVTAGRLTREARPTIEGRAETVVMDVEAAATTTASSAGSSTAWCVG
jgi:hypothetical protein